MIGASLQNINGGRLGGVRVCRSFRHNPAKADYLECSRSIQSVARAAISSQLVDSVQLMSTQVFCTSSV